MMNGLEESEDLCDPADQVVKADSGQYWDDLKGEVLDPKLARGTARGDGGFPDAQCV